MRTAIFFQNRASDCVVTIHTIHTNMLRVVSRQYRYTLSATFFSFAESNLAYGGDSFYRTMNVQSV